MESKELSEGAIRIPEQNSYFKRIKQCDQEFEKRINMTLNTYQRELNDFIFYSTLGLFPIFVYLRKGIFRGINTSLAYYVFSSLLICRDNLNPFANYKIK